MSLQLFAEDVVFLQRFLKCCEFYRGEIDGDWGPKTDAAVAEFDAESAVIAADLGMFDVASERYIRTLQPKAQREARAFLQRVLQAGISARILSGTRTYAEQNRLYRKGRYGDTSPIVTKARGGRSNHNFGIAWDISIFESGKYLGNSPLYARAATVGKVSGIEWGGDWTSFVDEPHYQLATGATLADVRTSFEGGEAFV
ncbi:MAG TPA: M15 family metallopeptidase [Gemmatimonadaceae bacterium]|nr:M15 family metallopeptidase [Gemmatimonadaceae bacterium]